MTDLPDLSKPASAFMAAAGLHLEETGPRKVTGWIELGPEHHQPFGVVHGGVYAAAIETAASVGATLAAQENGMVAVGANNNTNFLRSMTAGRVRVVAEPIQQGRTQQLWEVRLTDSDGRLVAVGQVRLQNITPRG
jgi:1,4-dihydroxy-2-naphthoyl-CoA hydrolase